MYASINKPMYKQYFKCLSDREMSMEINMIKYKWIHVFCMNSTFSHWKI